MVPSALVGIISLECRIAMALGTKSFVRFCRLWINNSFPIGKYFIIRIFTLVDDFIDVSAYVMPANMGRQVINLRLKYQINIHLFNFLLKGNKNSAGYLCEKY
jgi:hypothetical protein